MVVKRHSLDNVRNEAKELEVIRQRTKPEDNIIMCGDQLMFSRMPNTIFDPQTGAFMGIRSRYAQ